MIPSRNPILALVFLLAAVASHAAPPKPISLHPENPHYFAWRGDPTILITSGEHYGALLNRDFDYVRYFDELQSHGLNHTRVFTGVYREHSDAFRITDNTLAPASRHFLCPWARSDQHGGADGGGKFDLTKWDKTYFDRLHDLMTQAGERGIVVELTLFCPMYRDEMWNISPMNAQNNINGVGRCGREEVYTLKHRELLDVQVAVTRKLVRELHAYDNLYYEVCNEPYFGGVTMEWQHKIIDTIVQTENDLPAKHLISMNIANGRKQVVKPHPAVSIFNFHYCVPPDTVEINYDLNKVIGENETGFRGHEDVLYRTEGWDFLLAGGALYNNLDYSFTAGHPDGSLTDYESPGGGSAALRRQLGILKTFVDQLDFIHMKPESSVVQNVSPELTTSVLANRKKEIAIYLHVPLPNKPKRLADHLRNDIEATLTINLPAGEYTAEWLDPISGTLTSGDPITHAGGRLEIRSPNFDNDIALRIMRK